MKIYSVILNALPDKKIKYLGNKCLLNTNKNNLVIDSHIKTIRKLFKSTDISIIGGFDSKKLKKYIGLNLKYKDIKYIEHDITNYSNIGQSIKVAVSNMKNDTGCFLLNSNILLSPSIKIKIEKNTDKSFILTQNHGDIGYITSDDNYITHCYYGLPNGILDALFISKQDLQAAKKVILNTNIDRLYLFEVVNLLIENKINIIPVSTYKKHIEYIDSKYSLIN